MEVRFVIWIDTFILCQITAYIWTIVDELCDSDTCNQYLHMPLYVYVYESEFVIQTKNYSGGFFHR